MSKFSQILLAIILLLGGVVFFQHKHSARLSDERDRYKQNNTALLSDIERMQIDSTTMAVDAKALRLTIDEYERFRAADAEKIRQMGVKIKDLQAAAKHQLEVAAPINAVIRDTVFIRDTVPVIQQKVEMVSPHIQLDHQGLPPFFLTHLSCFIMKEFRGRGYAQQAMRLAEEIHGSSGWELDTILQEKGNCHLYEKLGYRQTGETKVVNERLTLVFYRK